eukprot:TRINITY_DN79919_c0_g1_i1.p1 TRINITY_DN79919_c0_g1~~TRINITY_DN79919_c0_g1_i1.p1  ORF type:complete len:261 (-),score=39.54 TRINITY_DN79919_c0_g1_i1:418-1200(-)
MEYVSRRVAVDWVMLDGQSEGWFGWVVGYRESEGEHIVAYDVASLESGSRVYAHNLSLLWVRFLDSNLANVNFSKPWREEDDHRLIRLEKRIKKAAKRGDNAQTQTWLWCAAACALGRFRVGKTGSECCASVRVRFARLSRVHGQRTGRKEVAATRLKKQHVETALQQLQNKSGSVKEIRTKIAKLYGHFDTTIASGEVNLTRWEKAVSDRLKDHPNRFKKEKIPGKGTIYTLCESKSVESPPEQSRVSFRDGKSRSASS